MNYLYGLKRRWFESMSHSPSEFIYYLKRSYRYRIQHLALAGELLRNRSLKLHYRNEIDIWYEFYGKDVHVYLKPKSDDYYLFKTTFKIKRDVFESYEQIAESIARIESTCREILRGKSCY